MNIAISRILVPLDFSVHSEFALRYAVWLAGRVEATLDLLHVVEDPIASGAWSPEVQIPNLAELRRNLMDQGEQQLEQYRATVTVPVVTAVRMGPTAEVITEYATACGIDLIVMGTHGRSGLAHLFMGSVAERVVRHAECPVLTLRDTTPREKTGGERGMIGSALGHTGTSRE